MIGKVWIISIMRKMVISIILIVNILNENYLPLVLWQCSGQQSSRFFWFRSSWLCSGLWRKPGFDRSMTPAPLNIVILRLVVIKRHSSCGLRSRLLKIFHKRHDSYSCDSDPTLPALVSLSPDSPTQMLRHSFLIFRSLITFLVLSFSGIFVIVYLSETDQNI